MSEGSKSRLPDGLLEFATAHLGRLCSVVDHSWQHGESDVWLVAGAAGEAVVKSHRQARKFHQERDAYRKWTPALAGGLPPEVGTPTLLATSEGDARALLLSAEPGRPAESVPLPPEREVELHLAAGSFLAALHALPLSHQDPVPVVEAIEMRIDSWGRRAEGLLPAGVAGRATARAREILTLLEDVPRAPCHRDYSPRNWLTAPGGRLLTVIDFEHSRPDLYLFDIERLWSGLWPERPDLKEAFLTGYGRSLTPDEEEILEGLAALAGIGTVVWAREHGDEDFEEQGRASLRRLGLDGPWR